MPIYSEYKNEKTRDCAYEHLKVTDPRNSRAIVPEYIYQARHLFDSYSAKVLDYGCGDDVLMIPQSYDRYDPDPKYDVTYHDRNDITKHYDMIVMKHVIEHAEVEEVTKMLQWARTHADRVILATPNVACQAFDFWKDLQHKRPYSNDQFLALVEAQGWTIEQVIFSYIGAKKRLPFRVLTALGNDIGLKSLYYEYMVVAR